VLSGLLQKTAKRLGQGLEAEGIVLLDAFSLEVERLMAEGLADVVGRSLIARANRARELIADPS